MDTILRAAFIYVFLLIVVRYSGRRTLASLSYFDLILTLIISECVQNALIGDDFSLTTGALAVVTLLLMDVGLSVTKLRFPRIEKLLDGVPTLLIKEGVMQKRMMQRERVDSEDILESARELQGLARIEDIRYAVLEKNGKITIVPFQPGTG